MRKLSEIIKEMACAVLKDPDAVPSSEVAHAGLLLAHVAWNRANGGNHPQPDYAQVLRAFTQSRPDLWDELTAREPDKLIEELVRYKNDRYPDDGRVVIVCGMREEKVHIEWVEPSEA